MLEIHLRRRTLACHAQGLDSTSSTRGKSRREAENVLSGHAVVLHAIIPAPGRLRQEDY